MNPILHSRAFLFIAAGAFSAAQSAPAPSAAATKDETVKLEAFSVTGSNIKSIEMERTLPVTTIKAEQLEIYDPGQPSDMLAALPMAAGLPGNEAALATQNARGDNANISFRGLASGNTLTAGAYINSITFLYVEGSLIAVAMERCGLRRASATRPLKKIPHGDRHHRAARAARHIGPDTIFERHPLHPLLCLQGCGLLLLRD